MITVWWRDRTRLLAAAVLVVAPLLAFRAVEAPSIVSIAMVVPAGYLAVARLRAPYAAVPHWPLLALALVSLSVLWSDDAAATAVELRTALPVLLATLLACASLAPRAILACLRTSFALIIASSLVELALVPSSRQLPGEVGVFLTAQFAKNAYAYLLCFALALVLARHRGLAMYVMAPPLLLLIAYNRSVTGWGVALTLVALRVVAGAVLRRLGVREGRGPALVIGTALGVLAVFVFSQLQGPLLAFLGKDPTLSSRTLIWRACWEQIQQAPFLGHGAYAFLYASGDLSPVTVAIWSQFRGYVPPHPHNSVLDVWGQLGIVGVVVFAGLLLAGVRGGLRVLPEDRELGAAALLGLAVVVLFGITEVTFAGPWLVVTTMLVSMVSRSRAEAVRRPAAPLRPGAATAPARAGVA